jgi:predicted ABC-type ATPase
MTEQKKVIIIAGPNGAGKTTFAREFLPGEAGLPVFVNADLIAAGISPFNPELAAIRAGRLMLREIDAHAAAGRRFAFESTLAGLTYIRRIDKWREQGGHNVTEEVIRRRFAAGMRHFLETYRYRVDYWMWFDNSGVEPVLLDEGKNP